MKTLNLLFILLLHISFISKTENKCTDLRQLAIEFDPNDIGLNNTLNKLTSTENMHKLIINCNTSRTWLILILLKEYKIDLLRGDQSYDMNSMKKGAAGEVITMFENIVGEHREFFSSYEVYAYVLKNKNLLRNPYIKGEVKKIQQIERQIDDMIKKRK